MLWLDYGIRMLLIALGAALGARWLAVPMRRLSTAATSLAASLGRGTPAAPMDERHGTVEVRDTAQAFNRMAEQLQQQFDARGLQMAAVSHDLRTPLTRLKLRLEKMPPELAEAASADIQEMDEMIAGTLAVLREQQDGSAAAAVDLGALVQSLVDDLADQGHEVVLESPPPLRVRAHPAGLKRVVGNLLGNALRYGGSARIALQAKADRVVVTIDDRGPGIPEALIERAFEPWVRLDESHARGGHGLGLAIARELAERDGGTLTLANRAEGGLRATLSLMPA
jgi:protein-histidine pros-kinase